MNEKNKYRNKTIVALVIMGMIFLLLTGCINGNNEKNETVKEKKEVTTIENITEKPKIVLNLSKYINSSYYTINYSKYKENKNLPLNVYFLNAGDDEKQKNGRAVIIKKGDFDMLIDGGVKERYSTIQYLISSISDDLEILVISNNNEENLENINDIIKDVGVGEIWYSEEEGLEDIIEYAKARGIELRKVKEGENFSYNGIEFKILNPPENSTFDDPSNNAIVIQVQDRGINVLLTTDIKDGAMGRLVSDYKNELEATVLEIPHYGDRIGQTNSRLFITEINPKIAIIEGYKPDDYNESSKIATYNLLNGIYDIETYETWNYNAVIFTYDGKRQGVTFIEKK